ncbi:copper amine oxidase N-terminal domain-containing protein [Lysinibacillus sp. FSL K6-4013]|uniref:copper amine oxidase N-terminal domain-containing protein n=1 Tax=Lysinibacillus sp. FSL K6-4013 TaxID=2921504 RepID=UPI0031599BDE
MKKIVSYILFALILISTNTVSAQSVVTITGGKMIDNRTLVPLRSIFEELGATVIWNQNTKTISATKDTTNISLKLGTKTAVINGQAVSIDVPAQIRNGTTLLPLRFISEALGANVKWDNKTLTATIEQNDKTISVKVEILKPEGNRNFLNITDAEIKEAIQERNKGVYHLHDIRKKYIVPVASDAFGLKYYQPIVNINTPYLTVLSVAALKTNKNETLSFSEAKKWVDIYKQSKSIDFTIETYGNSIDVIFNPINIVLKQGDNYIYPSSTTSLGVQRTTSWPNDPSYNENHTSFFPTNKIDTNQNATFILKMPDNKLITYNVVFSNYK